MTTITDKQAELLNGAGPMLTRQFCIRRLRRETLDTFSLELEPLQGPAAFPFVPGQFNMLYLFGVGEVAISISGNPAGKLGPAHTTREVGTVTRAMARLKKGGILGVRGPFGHGWPLAEAAGKDVVLVAGGIGLAPLRPALYQLMAQRANYGRVVLLYGVRTPEDILYWQELDRWRRAAALEVYLTVDRATGGWPGNVGVVTSLIPRAPFDPHNALALVCGPEIMMRYTTLELRKRGLPVHSIYLSLERNMKCGIGNCGHCQAGPVFVCRDGPVFRFDRVKDWMDIREL